MRKTALLFVVPLAVASKSLRTDQHRTGQRGTFIVWDEQCCGFCCSTTLPISTVPSTTPSSSSSSPTATGNILMIKLYVGNIPRAEKFYGALFGAKLAVKLGKYAQIVTFPKGPGLALLQKTAADKNKVGAPSFKFRA